MTRGILRCDRWYRFLEDGILALGLDDEGRVCLVEDDETPRHAALLAIEERFYFLPFPGKVKILVDDRRVCALDLAGGERIRIGRDTLVFGVEGNRKAREEPEAIRNDPEKTPNDVDLILAGPTGKMLERIADLHACTEIGQVGVRLLTEALTLAAATRGVLLLEAPDGKRRLALSRRGKEILHWTGAEAAQAEARANEAVTKEPSRIVVAPKGSAGDHLVGLVLPLVTGIVSRAVLYVEKPGQGDGFEAGVEEALALWARHGEIALSRCLVAPSSPSNSR